MPLYEYRCQEGHESEELRKYEERDDALACPECGGDMHRIVSAHHRQPDGIYSYEPNIGDPKRFEEKRENARD